MEPLSIDAVMEQSTGGRRPDPMARLGRAAMLLSRELAETRQEVVELRRENADLRRRLASHPSGWGR